MNRDMSITTEIWLTKVNKLEEKGPFESSSQPCSWNWLSLTFKKKYEYLFFLEPKKRQMWLKVWFSKLEEAENLNCGIFEVEEEDVDFVSSRFVLRTYYY